MGLRDSFTTALGSAFGAGVGLLSEAFQKAARDDEPASAGGTPPSARAGSQGRADVPPQPSGEDPRALLYDPFALIDQLGYRDRPSGLTYGTLREMSKRVPTYMAIVQTRVTQVSAFGQRQKDPRDAGFAVMLRDHKASPSDNDKARMRELEDWLLNTGSTWSPGRDNFRTFLRKLARDSLDLDQACFEIVRNRKGLPAEFYALDAATIRLADVPPGAEATQDPNQVKYVQVYDEVIISEFAAHELNFGVRNPRTDIRVNGYGFSELEMLINVITATLWAFEYNKRQFSQGSLVNGIMNFKGTVPDKKMDAFRRHWKMMVSGVGNAHKVPITNVDEVQWIDFGKTNRDMEYGEWMDWLIKITCGVLQFDPAEMNFTYGNSGQGQQMFGTPVEGKLRASKDKGLRPLLKDIAEWVNNNLIWPLDPYYEFGFMGIDAKSADQAIDLSKKQSEYLKTIDELRAEDDLDPLPDGKGAVILNPTWVQFAQMAAMGGGQGGPPGPDSDGTNATDGAANLGGSDVTALQGEASKPDLTDEDYDSLFPEKSVQQRDQLRKAGTKAKVTELQKGNVKVYEIDL